MTDAFEIVLFDGKRVDRKTAAALHEAEKQLGYELSITQGSYNGGGVAASAGTHDGGGVVDLRAWDWQSKVRVLRSVGFAAWYRDPSEGPWPAHIHAVLIDHERLAPSAARQVDAYRAGRNGLANNGPDTFGYRPSPIPVFRYVPEPRVKVSLSRLQVDFRNALDRDCAPNPPTRRGRIVQRRLNRKMRAGLKVDGVIGPVTAKAWRAWERNRVGVHLRPGVPDKRSLRRLLAGSIYYMTK